MKFIYNDGGRNGCGYKGLTGDCVTRAISIVTGKPYKEVYDALNELAKSEKTGKRKHKISNSAKGVYRITYEKYLKSLGYVWIPTMKIGSGCKVHLRENELPYSRLVVTVSKHVTAIIDGEIHDLYDCSRNGNRCVYGYYIKNVDSSN